MLIARSADLQVSFPTSWPEVTLRQVLALENSPSIIFALASDPLLLRQLPDPNAGTAILPHLAFTSDVPDFAAMALPDRLTLTVPDADGQPVERLVKRPVDLGLESYGQKITINEELRRLREADRLNYLDAALPLLSVYFYPQLSGKPFLDIADTKPYESAILDLPCTVALPLSAFFLGKPIGSTGSGPTTYRPVNLTTKPFPLWKQLVRWCRN